MRRRVAVGAGLAWLLAAGAALAADPALPAELIYVPQNAALVTSVDLVRVRAAGVADAVTPMRQRSLAATAELERVAGVRADADRVVVVVSGPSGEANRRTQVVIAVGGVDVDSVLRDARAHGGVLETYGASRVATFGSASGGFLVAAPEPAILLFGDAVAVRAALDARADGAQRWIGRPGVGPFVATVASAPAWLVARSETVPGNAPVPPAVLEQLPPLEWIAAAVQTEPGFRGVLSAEARDEAGAVRLREVLDGLMALARVQGAQRPEWRAVLGTLQPAVRGNVVSVSVDLTRDLLARLVGGGVLR